ncbi:hypothetical protein Tco_0976036 [Tanacetum coccineum]|uniref:Uncharacterized protein n=1 Tax=Tanacetum coccineum TaxID=301880 RepID=A0ABQ5EG34_9ASTR
MASIHHQQIPFPLSPPSPVLTSPPHSPIRSLGYRVTTIRMRAKAVATSHSLLLPLPFILSPHPDQMHPHPCPISSLLSINPTQSLGPSYDVGESSAAAGTRPAGGLKADYGFVATMDREIRRDPKRYVGYGITDSWDEIVETLQGAPVRRDTDEIYMMLDDEQSQRQLLACRVNTLFRDRRGHAHIRLLMETDARMSREAWGKSIDASDLARAEVMSLRTTVHAHMSEITEYSQRIVVYGERFSDLLETDQHTTERDDSTSGIGHHTAWAGDSFTRAGDGIIGASYCITGIAGTRWGSCTARAARGGW